VTATVAKPEAAEIGAGGPEKFPQLAQAYLGQRASARVKVVSYHQAQTFPEENHHEKDQSL
jgi:hypothetical protein